VAQTLLDGGAQQQDKIALYLHNGPEYLEAMFASFKAGLVPVNTNYRYAEDELVYLWTNADAVAVVFGGTYSDTIAGLRDRVPDVTRWLWVDDGNGGCPDWATPYESAATREVERVRAPWGRSGSDLFLLYTGGTTGMPKGVMWRQDDLFVALNAGAPRKRHLGQTADLDLVAELVDSPGIVNLPGCPLMHGTGCFAAMTALSVGGSVVTLTGRSFDAIEMLDTIERNSVNSIAIVGDAFAKPLLSALDAEPTRWNLATLKVVVSSGVIWSEATKQGLLAHHPKMLLVDSLGSSEAIGMAQSVSTSDGQAATATFELGDDTQVITDDGRFVEPGSGERGRVATRGRTPIGYYKDEDKSAGTFIEIEGSRWSIPGDYATVSADGTLELLGRGSGCINTGGEKVFPEEVEEVLKELDSVADAVVVGIPDDKFGEAITALVESTGPSFDEADLIAHVKNRLAHYKAPKHVIEVATVGRAANGKVDYKRHKAHAIETLTD
jgi:fatty-acyl-CoA synthase